MKPYYQDSAVTIYHGDCREIDPPDCDLVLLDPPFDEWGKSPQFDYPSLVCFTNFNNRHYVEARYGLPRTEVIWHFRDGRWVSHNLPRITHETILVFGEWGEVYVGEEQDTLPQKKGKGCVGRHKLEERTYVPRHRKALNSVISYPRNVLNPFGCWGKPVPLIRDILEWSSSDTVFDPYSGSGTTGVAAKELGIKAILVEKDEESCEIAAKRMSQEVLAL
jgi:site-specific DNA-methyltransferase (adenine-specific)